MNTAATLTEIQTERLILKGFDSAHMQDLFEIFGDEETMEFYDLYAYTKPEEVKTILDFKNRIWNEGTGMRWGMFFEEKLIGTCGFNRYKPKGNAVIGYDLNKKYWQKGFASEAVLTMTNFGFEQLEIHRIEAHVTPGNIASEKLLQKCGFEKEGILKDVAFFRGSYQDQVLYAKINQNQ
jgi:ribosomal-protein-alanine N-acetyltransferase